MTTPTDRGGQGGVDVSIPLGGSRWFFWLSFVAFILTFLVVPMFIYPKGEKSHCDLEGTLLASLGAALGAGGFMTCPRDRLLAKLITGFICVCSVVMGIYAVIQYLRYGGGVS